MTMRKMRHQRGFIALTSAILISTVLLSAAATIGYSSLFARLDSLNAEYKRVSLGFAESCILVALLRVGQNYLYVPAVEGDSVVIGVDAQGEQEECRIQSVTYEPEASGKKIATIRTQGRYRTTFSNVLVQATVLNPRVTPSRFESNLSIISWQETPE